MFLVRIFYDLHDVIRKEGTGCNQMKRLMVVCLLQTVWKQRSSDSPVGRIKRRMKAVHVLSLQLQLVTSIMSSTTHKTSHLFWTMTSWKNMLTFCQSICAHNWFISMQKVLSDHLRMAPCALLNYSFLNNCNSFNQNTKWCISSCNCSIITPLVFFRGVTNTEEGLLILKGAEITRLQTHT